MLAKKHRFPIQRVFQKKSLRSVSSSLFLLKIFPNQIGFRRYGVAISKKISSSAVERNKIKRLIFRLLQSLPRSSDAQDFLLILNPRIKDVAPAEVKVQLKELISRV